MDLLWKLFQYPIPHLIPAFTFLDKFRVLVWFCWQWIRKFQEWENVCLLRKTAETEFIVGEKNVISNESQIMFYLNDFLNIL
jgi:hypothetical protein